MKRIDPVFAALLVCYAALAFAAGARDFLDYDSAQMGLALGQHDLRLHQPQPPGFILYVWVAGFVRAFVGDEYVALRIVAVFFVLAGAWVIRRLGTQAYDAMTGNVAALLFLSSPLVLFHSMTTMMYAAEPWIAALVALLCLRAIRTGNARHLMQAGFVTGILGGLRQPTLLFETPLLVLALVRGGFDRRAAAGGILAWGLGNLAWAVPQVLHAGSFADYVDANVRLHAHVFATSPLRRGGPELVDALHRATNVFLFGVGAFRLVAAAMCRLRPQQAIPSARGLDATFYLTWTIPALLVHLVYHFARPGYALVYWPALCLLLAAGLQRALRATTPALRRRFIAGVGAAALLDVALFFALPTAHIGREPWELAGPPAASATRMAARWQHVPLDNGPAARLARAFFGRVDFFHDRCSDFRFGGFLDALRAQGFPNPDAVLIGRGATRIASFRMPEQPIVHVDPLRPQPFVAYRNRHGTVIDGDYEVPQDVRWLIVDSTDGKLRIADPSARITPLAPPLQGFLCIEVGGNDIDAVYEPRRLDGAAASNLSIRRRHAPSD